MSNKVAVDFIMKFYADGSHNTLAVSLATHPITLIAPVEGTAAMLGGLGYTPLSVSNLYCSTADITGATFLLGIMTLTFADDVVEGFHYIQGTFKF